MLSGKVPERGVLPPQACFDPRSFEEDLVALLPDLPKDEKLLTGSLRYVD